MGIRIREANEPRAVKYAISAASFLNPDLMGIDINNAFKYERCVSALTNLIQCERSFKDIKTIINFGIKDFKMNPTHTSKDLIDILNLTERKIFNKKNKQILSNLSD